MRTREKERESERERNANWPNPRTVLTNKTTSRPKRNLHQQKPSKIKPPETSAEWK